MMDVISQQQSYLEIQGPSNTRPSLMARPVPGYLYSTTHHHIIEMIPRSYEPSISTSTQDTSSVALPVSRVSNGSNSRNSSFVRQERSLLNSGLWVSIEMVFNLCKIFVAVIVLSLSRHEHSHTPFFEWIVGYASGCVATLPLLYWQYYHGNHVQEQHSSLSHQGSPRINGPPRTLLSTSRTNRGEGVQVVAAASPRSNQPSWLMNTRYSIAMLVYNMPSICL